MSQTLNVLDTAQQLKAYYQQKAQDSAEEQEFLKSKYNRYSLIRLAFFLLGAGLVAYLWAALYWWIGLIAASAFLFFFVRFVRWHQNIKKQEIHQKHLHQININEGKAMNNDFSSFEGKASFIDVNHPYASDLDIFGDHSLYQAANRTVTNLGQQKLADLLLEYTSISEIKKRQEVLQELSPMIDWRQDFQAIGLDSAFNPKDLDKLYQWIAMPYFYENRKWMHILRWLLPFLTMGGLSLCFIFLPLEAAVFMLLPNFLLLRSTFKDVNEIHERTDKAGEILKVYADLIAHIENQEFDHPWLKEQQALFIENNVKASRAISKLSYIISQLNVRYNAFAAIINVFMLWDLQWMRRLDTWKKKYGVHLKDWFHGLENFDAFNSLATLVADNPEWTYPTIVNDNLLNTEELGHPLIDRIVRVSNDLIMSTTGHIKLITGSNMGGKSTFLRTLGLNVIQAMAGLPVCAKKMSLPILQVYTSMRTQDSLHENTSSFFAELKRLRTIIEAVEEHETDKPGILFLLDEILKGTNSMDRHTGGKALILQMIKAGGAGLVATHDLELGILESEHPDAIENWCFEVAIDEGKLDFDYKLKRGVSKSFNATILMREMGIKV